MRLVFVNHSHPSVPHVSGIRAWNFARALTARGHQVVVICEWRESVAAPPIATSIGEQLRAHGWQDPFVLAVKPTAVPLLHRVRSPETGTLSRKAQVLTSYLTASGVFTDFSHGAQPYLAQLAQAFKP
ncbi:MAG: hypothetical protein ABIP90_06960, partial [Vicinamibacterales bacterium]